MSKFNSEMMKTIDKRETFCPFWRLVKGNINVGAQICIGIQMYCTHILFTPVMPWHLIANIDKAFNRLGTGSFYIYFLSYFSIHRKNCQP